MDFTKTLKKSWNYLPCVSFVRNEEKVERGESLPSRGKFWGHLAYAMAPFVYLISSFVIGTPNPLNWNEIAGQRQREVQEYNILANQATNCVGGEDGFNIPEMNELSRRAEINFRAPESFGVNFRNKSFYIFEFPGLTKKDLEKVVQSCEAEK